MIMKKIAMLSIILIVLVSLCTNNQPQPSGGDGNSSIKTPPKKTPEPASSSVPIPVPNTSACAITSPPLSMEGINTHPEVYGTGADPNIITLGPKLGAHPDWQPYQNKISVEFELKRGTPVLAPIDMVLVGVNNRGAAYRIQDGVKVSPFDDLGLYFESA